LIRLPSNPKQSPRCWSEVIIKMFGLRRMRSLPAG
jgi:hypothetical protein